VLIFLLHWAFFLFIGLHAVIIMYCTSRLPCGGISLSGDVEKSLEVKDNKGIIIRIYFWITRMDDS